MSALEWKQLFEKRFELTFPSFEGLCDEGNRQTEAVESSAIFFAKFMHHLEELKDELNYTKSRLNDFDIKIWRTHTNFTNLCGNLSRYCKKTLNAELCTQAWLKFCTIINTFDLIKAEYHDLQKHFTSVHLCEAPGAFITCLNQHIVTKRLNLTWNWLATTFNPYYEGNDIGEMINDDRFIKNTLCNWTFGEDFTGDITNLKNLHHLKEICKKYSSVDLVTADGSIDCSENPEMQESLVAQLLYWESITALHIMSTGANFVIKAFTVLEEFTISLVYILCSAFKQVHFCKPGPSKPGNSEVYIVCLGFHGLDLLGKEFLDLVMQRTCSSDFTTSLVSLKSIPEDFMTRLLECEEFFIRQQIQAIESNISSFENMPKKKRKYISEMKDAICKKFIENFHLQPLMPEKHVTFIEGAAHSRLASRYSKEHSHNFTSGNFYERQEKKHSSWVERTKFDDSKELVEEAPHVHWFSNKMRKLTEEETLEWNPIVGKKYLTCKSTQFSSNYTMLDLFEARSLMVSFRPTFLAHDEDSGEEDSLITLRAVAGLDHFLRSIDCPEVAVVDVTAESSSLELKKFAFQSLEHTQNTFMDFYLKETSKCHYQYMETEFEQTLPLSGQQTTKISSAVGESSAATLVGMEEHLSQGLDNAIQDSNSLERDQAILAKTIDILKQGSTNSKEGIDLLCATACKGDDVFDHETSKNSLLLVLALSLTSLKSGGSLVCKIADLFTNFNAGIIFILSRTFSRIGIFKAKEHALQPTRFLICQGYQGKYEILSSYLNKLLMLRINVLKDKPEMKDILHIMPISCTNDEKFLQFLKTANESHSNMQLKSMRKVQS